MSDSFIRAATKRRAKSKEVAEVDIEGDFVKFAKGKGCKALKLILLNLRGFPDRTVLCPGGRILFIEFKKKGKVQTPTQRGLQRVLEGFGFAYHVCDEKGQAEKLLIKFLN